MLIPITGRKTNSIFTLENKRDDIAAKYHLYDNMSMLGDHQQHADEKLSTVIAHQIIVFRYHETKSGR